MEIKLIDSHNFTRDSLKGFQRYQEVKNVYRLQNGESVPSVQTLPASGCIHPGTPEMVQLLPEEERHEEFISVYTGFPLRLGENSGGATYTAPDRILWNGETWRVIRVRDWSVFGYYQGLAVKMHE